jgi:hypothetical protein
MIEVKIETTKTINADRAALVVQQECQRLSRDLSEEYARQTRLSLVLAQKVALGGTLRSVRAEQQSTASRDVFRSRVVAARSIVYINDGRRAGARHPVRFIGTESYTTKKGQTRERKLFDVLEPFKTWLLHFSIPRAAWWLILMKIKKRGIRAQPIQSLTLRRAEPRKQTLCRHAAQSIARRMFSYGRD